MINFRSPPSPPPHGPLVRYLTWRRRPISDEYGPGLPWPSAAAETRARRLLIAAIPDDRFGRTRGETTNATYYGRRMSTFRTVVSTRLPIVVRADGPCVRVYPYGVRTRTDKSPVPETVARHRRVDDPFATVVLHKYLVIRTGRESIRRACRSPHGEQHIETAIITIRRVCLRAPTVRQWIVSIDFSIRSSRAHVTHASARVPYNTTAETLRQRPEGFQNVIITLRTRGKTAGWTDVVWKQAIFTLLRSYTFHRTN